MSDDNGQRFIDTKIADIAKAAGESAKVTVDRRPDSTRILITYKDGRVVKEGG